eukprot:975817-Lingulodinium_polyedra.AAC.2
MPEAELSIIARNTTLAQHMFRSAASVCTSVAASKPSTHTACFLSHRRCCPVVCPPSAWTKLTDLAFAEDVERVLNATGDATA